MAPAGDVLVVGAGPTGLLLAGDLGAAGVRCTVLERRSAELNLTRAFAVHARTLEMLDMRGVAGELVRTGERISTVRLFGRAPLRLWRLPGRFPFLLITPQYETERVLEERALEAGARIAWDSELIGLDQDSGGVEAQVRRGDGTERVLRASYLVGTDGARSTVRRLLGVPFPGRSTAQSLMLADVRLQEAPREVLTLGAVGDAFAFLAPFGDGWYRVIAWNRRNLVAEGEPVSMEEIREATRRALGTDYGMSDPRWTSRFHSDERQVTRYRDGRVFLAGDAAHVHSPAGGQGMNLGIQDAANLGWKLAAVLHGWAPPELLDSYHDERYPVGRAVLRASGFMLRVGLIESRSLRAVRGFVARVATRIGPVERRAAGRLSGIDIAYQAPPGAHRLTGRRAPDVRLAGERGRLFEVLRDGRFVLVVAANDPAVTYLATKRWADRVHCVLAGGATRTTVLVRPDGYIAWATDETAPDRRAAAIREALTRWCGAPTEFPQHERRA
jgi:2-polyprenyl-6-methoxyphenol hydroxylase-like FAD-dependent oxidoreductase